MKRDFDLIVFGATGYTGRLIAEYLATSFRGDDAPSWAIAGRSTDKLQKVRAEIGAPNDLPLVKADAAESASLRSMCERAAVIITTVMPSKATGKVMSAHALVHHGESALMGWHRLDAPGATSSRAVLRVHARLRRTIHVRSRSARRSGAEAGPSAVGLPTGRQ